MANACGPRRSGSTFPRPDSLEPLRWEWRFRSLRPGAPGRGDCWPKPGTTMKIRHRAYAYITNRNRLLLFTQPASPDAGIQVPAGTIESGESLEHAVMREAREKTGLTGLKHERFLAQDTRDMSDYGRAELQYHWLEAWRIRGGRICEHTVRHLRVRIRGTAPLQCVQVIHCGHPLAELPVTADSPDLDTEWVDERPGRPLEDVFLLPPCPPARRRVPVDLAVLDRSARGLIKRRCGAESGVSQHRVPAQRQPAARRCAGP